MVCKRRFGLGTVHFFASFEFVEVLPPDSVKLLDS